MRFGIEIEREVDGRWIGAVVEMPGAMAYGASADEALANVQALALRVIADRVEQAEFPRGPLSVEFEISPAGA